MIASRRVFYCHFSDFKCFWRILPKFRVNFITMNLEIFFCLCFNVKACKKHLTDGALRYCFHLEDKKFMDVINCIRIFWRQVTFRFPFFFATCLCYHSNLCNLWLFKYLIYLQVMDFVNDAVMTLDAFAATYAPASLYFSLLEMRCQLLLLSLWNRHLCFFFLLNFVM